MMTGICLFRTLILCLMLGLCASALGQPMNISTLEERFKSDSVVLLVFSRETNKVFVMKPEAILEDRDQRIDSLQAQINRIIGILSKKQRKRLGIP